MIQKRLLFIILVALLAACSAAPVAPTVIPTPTEMLVKIPTLTPTPAAEAANAPLHWAGENPPLLMAHYMPWYQSLKGSGAWGWHWTMNHFTPRLSDDGQWTEFASHYTPLTGLYDSSDEAILEYQVQLMKLSGIDGVIVDWYGIENFWDYGTIHASTQKLFEVIKKAGLKFVICYEDQTVKHMLENGHLQQADALAHGQDVMRYLQDTWFTDDAYLKFNGQPLLFVFGPQYFKSGEEWNGLFTALDPQPLLVTLDNPTPGAAVAAYPWPPMWASKGGVLSNEDLQAYLVDFYQKSQSWPFHAAGAFPGFDDIYQEAEVSASYGFLDAQDGQVFRTTLQQALDHNPDLIQLITWNDYGEGTVIEPTLELGYRYLETVLEARQALSGGAHPYGPADLRLPYELYQMRGQYAADAAVSSELEQASAALLAGDVPGAEEILARYR